MNQIVELSKASVEMIEPDVLLTQCKSHGSINEDDAKEIDDTYLTMSQGNDMFVLMDMRESYSRINRNAEYYFLWQAKMLPFTKAVAVIKKTKGSILSRMISKRSLHPYKEFSKVEDAQEWFKSLRAQVELSC